MWGIAFSFNPVNWRLGWSDAMDYDASGREIIVGKWFFLGPVALTYDYE
jgi:hypothetical protein